MRESRKFLLAVSALAGLFVLAGASVAAVTLQSIPSPEELFSRRVVQSTKIYDRTGAVLLYELHGEVKRTVVPLSEMPNAVKNATIAVEDANFYQHNGVDVRGILRAIIVNLSARDLRQGGSTITQQLVKNSFLGRERTFARKIREALLAIALETKLSKDQILELYLNQIPYGSNAYGIEAAAQTFFGKRARDLTTSEAATLAALPRAPSRLSPYGAHKDELMERRNFVIRRMRDQGYITESEAQAALAQNPKFMPASKGIRAPHFVMFVRDYLIERYGEDEVAQGGLSVTTTLDWSLQEIAEATVKKHAEKNNSLIRAANMALVAVDPRSGDILAMVGSRDFFADPEPSGCMPGSTCKLDPQVNVAVKLRQPGSAFKPFVYATAFKKGFTLDAVLFDVPTEFNTYCNADGSAPPGVDPKSCYHPQNYDETFRGPVTLRQALAQSLNVPSVKLLYLAGIADSIKTAQDLGISTLGDPKRYGLSLVLGGAEVKLLDMVSAYGAFAQDGIEAPAAPILKITDAAGNVLEEKSDQKKPALDTQIARLITNVLSDNDARIGVFQPRSSLYFPDRQVAAKTGTTQDYHDAWTIGYTPSLVAGVWAGNSDNSPVQQKGSGVLAAAPAWHEFMAAALEKTPPESFAPPDPPSPDLKPALRGVWQGDTVVTIDTVSQKRATDFTPPEFRKDIAFGNPHDPLYWINPQNPSGPPSYGNDPQYPHWEAAFQNWRAAADFGSRPLSAMPQGADDVHVPDKEPKITLETSSGADGSLRVRAAVDSSYPLREVALVRDDEVLLSRGAARIAEFLVPESERRGSMEVRAYDSVGNIGRAAVSP